MKKEVKILLALSSAIALATIFGLRAYKTSSGGSSERSVRSELVREDSPTLGSRDSSVTIVEFLDPECESCKAFFPVMKDVLKKYEGKVYFVVRYMAFHKSSQMAVAATEAAGLQGKYWQMQEYLFSTTDEWSHQPTPNRAYFIKYAVELGLDLTSFERDLDDNRWITKVNRDMADGQTLGVRGTPTIFINGVRLESLNQASLESAIESVLSGS